jgi:hypothetical protein
VGVIPVTRSGRHPATRAAGPCTGQIPSLSEEDRESDELLPFQTGVAMMAIKTGVPVCRYLDGSQRGTDGPRILPGKNRQSPSAPRFS